MIMTTTTSPKTYTIDASGRKLGRLATELAVIVLGKDLPEYAPNTVANVRVQVTNASKMDVSQDKLDNKMYYHHTGYPGGDRHTPMKRVVENKGYGEALLRAVRGMLPKNKLQKRRLMLITVEE